MSWAIHVANVEAAKVEDELRAKAEELYPPDGRADGVSEQIDEVLPIAAKLAAGTGATRVNASASGHAAQGESDTNSLAASAYGVAEPAASDDEEAG